MSFSRSCSRVGSSSMTIAASSSATRYGSGMPASARSTRRSNAAARALARATPRAEPRERFGMSTGSSHTAAARPATADTLHGMKVVHTERHRAHDPKHETYLGVPVPAWEVPARADSIIAALRADDDFEIVEPTEHGTAPITTVHDPGLGRFLEVAWQEVQRQQIDREFLVADTYPTRA